MKNWLIEETGQHSCNKLKLSLWKKRGRIVKYFKKNKIIQEFPTREENAYNM